MERTAAPVRAPDHHRCNPSWKYNCKGGFHTWMAYSTPLPTKPKSGFGSWKTAIPVLLLLGRMDWTLAFGGLVSARRVEIPVWSWGFGPS
jgi:hypothetical protein